MGTDLVEDDGVQHVDALRDDDGAVAAGHRAEAAGAAGLEIVPRHLHGLPHRETVDAVEQQVPVHAVRRLPVLGLRRTLIQREEEIVHAEQTDTDAEIFEIRLEAHGSGRLAGAGRAGQADEGLFRLRREHGCRRRADLIVKHLLTAEDELCLIAHGEDNILHIDDTHDLTS